MISLAAEQADLPPAVRRLAALGPLDLTARTALGEAMRQVRTLKSHREMQREGAPIRETCLMLSGWAARVRQFEDGRRQILSFLLPGDLVGHCTQTGALSVCSVVALTKIEYCPAPAPEVSASLAEAYAVSHALEEAHLLAQIARLGRMSAEERFADLMLELHERFARAGLADDTGFYCPLTQETLADAVGLSCVHINRTIQSLRRQGDIAFKSGYMTLPEPAQLARRLGRNPARVTSQGDVAPTG